MAALAVRAFSNTNIHSIVCVMLCWLSGFSRTAVSALMYPDLSHLWSAVQILLFGSSA